MHLQRHHHYGIGFLIGLLVFTGFVRYQAPKASALTDVVVTIDNGGDVGPSGEYFCNDSAPGVCTLRTAINGILAENVNILAPSLGDSATWADNYHFIIQFSPSISSVNLSGGTSGDLPELNFPGCTNCTFEIDGLAGRASRVTLEAAAELHGLTVSDPLHQVIIKNIKFTNASDTAVLVKNSTIPHEIRDNLFGPQSLGDAASIANGTAVKISNAAHTKVLNNTTGGTTSNAIVLSGANTFDIVVSQNHIGVDPGNIGTALPSTGGSGIFIESGAHDNLIKGTADKNVIAHTGQRGINIDSGSKNTIEEENIFFDNNGEAIKLNPLNPSTIAKPNLINALDNGSTIKVKGTGIANSQINFYRADNLSNPTVIPDIGGGEGFYYIQKNTIDGSGDLDTDPGEFEFVLTGTSLGQTITAFQTSLQNSSEFSNNVVITNAPVNQPPTTNPTATPLNPTSESTVTLNAHASDPEGDPLTYTWSKTAGPAGGIFSSTTSSTANFTLPSIASPTVFTFSVTVSDGTSTASGTVSVTAQPTPLPNQPPTTNPTATPPNPSSESTISLNANASDPDGDPLTYTWSKTAGPPGGSFNSTTASTVNFTLPFVAVSTVFTFSVTVSDGTATASGTVSVTAEPRLIPNSPPVANAGTDQTIIQESNVLLNGSGSSDPNNDPLTYTWTQSGTDPYLVILTNQNTITPSFTAPNITELTTDLHFTLQVKDPGNLTSTDTVIVTITRNKQKPIAKLKVFPSDEVLPGTQVILSGTQSTFDSSATTNKYTFRQITNSSSDIPLIITHTNNTTPQASVLMPTGITTSTDFTFELVVNDGNQNSDPDTERVTVSPQAPSTPSVCSTIPPNANAGDNIDESKIPGEIITLNASRSSDEDNNLPLTYFWRQLAGGVRVDIRNNQSAQPNFTVPALTTPSVTMGFQLTVTDSCGLSDTDQLSITLRNTDPDNDGLDNTREAELHTNPLNPDTDGDGVPDGTEARSGNMDPINPDTDNDGLRDGEEDSNHNGIAETGETNAGNADTDGDTMPDGFEVRNQLNPNNPSDAAEDGDRDGLLNREEFIFKTNPKNPDSDGDGINDFTEAKGANKTFPNDSDTDDDGITDGNEDINHDGITQTNETSPVRFDTDADGLSDGQEIGLAQPQSKGTDMKKFKTDTDPLSKTAPLSADTDGDRIPDGVEDANKNGRWDCGETNPLDPANIPKPCITPTPTPTKTSRSQSTSTSSISVSKGNGPTNQNTQPQIQQPQQKTITIVPGASITVKGINKQAQKPSQLFSINPEASIVVLPSILATVGPGQFLPSIIVFAANALLGK